jgi:ABC-type phosphate transport system substrate-binding protein
MSKLKLMGATALIAATAALGGVAHAAPTTTLYGAGSSLDAPYLRQIFDCFGNAPAIYAGSSTPNQDGFSVKGTGFTNPTTLPVSYYNYTGTPAQNCNPTAGQETNTSLEFDYLSTGSGTGLKGLFSHSASAYWGDEVTNVQANTLLAIPAVNYAASDTALSATDVADWNNCGGLSTCTDPTTGIALGTAYPIPGPMYGKVIQVPILITPIDLAYSAEYGRYLDSSSVMHHLHFNVKHPRADGSGGLVLSAATYCKIFEGEITNWNDPAITADNGGQSLQDPVEKAANIAFNVPLVLVGRSDSSGSTSIFTRHLGAQCPSLITGTQYYNIGQTASTLPSGLIAATWTSTNPNYGSASGVTDVPGRYTIASGSGGVAAYLNFDPNNAPTTPGSEVVQGRIGYVGPDYVLPSVANTGNNNFGLNTASLLRPGTKAAISPTPATTLLAYGGISAPTGSAKADASNWVQAPNTAAPIAIPSNLKAYPIAGSSNLLTYTCFSSSTTPAALKAFYKYFTTSKTVTGLYSSAGLSALPLSFRTAINTEFFNPTVTTKADALYVSTAASATDTQCTSVTPGA